MTDKATLAALEFFADCHELFSEQDNPLGGGLPETTALRVCRGNLGQIRRWWERARTQLEEAAK